MAATKKGIKLFLRPEELPFRRTAAHPESLHLVLVNSGSGCGFGGVLVRAGGGGGNKGTAAAGGGGNRGTVAAGACPPHRT